MAARTPNTSISGLAYPGRVPLPLRLIAGSLLVLVGVALLAVAVLGARSRLRRNRWVGVRTPTTLRSDAAFTVANRVAAVPVGAAGAVAAVGGTALLAGATGALAWVMFTVTVAGLVMLAGAGGVVGDRIAAAVAAQPPAAPSCSGVCAGCDLVAGCHEVSERA